MRGGRATPTVAGMGDAVELEVAGRTVRLSSPDKMFFPERGFTKLDLARYYIAVGPGILRALRDRPTTLERYPEGVNGENFFQKRAPKNMPDWIPTAHITFPSGRSADEMCPTEAGAVVWAAQFGTLTFHPWPVRRDDVDHPDELRIDLDPQPAPTTTTPPAPPTNYGRCSTSSADCAASPRRRAAGACTCSCPSNRAGPSPRSAVRPSQSAGRWNGGCPST